jgi:hypothetical protein
MATAVLTALAGSAPVARADGGEGFGFGLVIGYSDNRSWSVGWEAGANTGGPLLKLSLGGSYRVDGESRDPLAIHYVAFEPWLIVGGTVGVAVTNEPEVRVAYGLWEGFAIPLEGDLWGGTAGDDEHPQSLLFTFAFGWRGFGATQQFYFTPKLWRFSTLEFNS